MLQAQRRFSVGHENERRIRKATVTLHVRQMLRSIKDLGLQRHNHLSVESKLTPTSIGCFSLKGHLRHVYKYSEIELSEKLKQSN